jgi:hypothetical protein
VVSVVAASAEGKSCRLRDGALASRSPHWRHRGHPERTSELPEPAHASAGEQDGWSQGREPTATKQG